MMSEKIKCKLITPTKKNATFFSIKLLDLSPIPPSQKKVRKIFNNSLYFCEMCNIEIIVNIVEKLRIVKIVNQVKIFKTDYPLWKGRSFPRSGKKCYQQCKCFFEILSN